MKKIISKSEYKDDIIALDLLESKSGSRKMKGF